MCLKSKVLFPSCQKEAGVSIVTLVDIPSLALLPAAPNKGIAELPFIISSPSDGKSASKIVKVREAVDAPDGLLVLTTTDAFSGVLPCRSRG